MLSPKSFTANTLLSKNSHASPNAACNSRSTLPEGNVQSALVMNSADGIGARLTTAWLTPFCSLDKASTEPATMASQPKSKSASPVAMRVA